MRIGAVVRNRVFPAVDRHFAVFAVTREQRRQFGEGSAPGVVDMHAVSIFHMSGSSGQNLGVREKVLHLICHPVQFHRADFRIAGQIRVAALPDLFRAVRQNITVLLRIPGDSDISRIVGACGHLIIDVDQDRHYGRVIVEAPGADVLRRQGTPQPGALLRRMIVELVIVEFNPFDAKEPLLVVDVVKGSRVHALRISRIDAEFLHGPDAFPRHIVHRVPERGPHALP